MKSCAYIAVVALLLVSVRASDDDDRSRLVEKMLRLAGEHVGPKLLPALRKSHIGEVRHVAADEAHISRYSFSIQSDTQNVDGLLTDVTVSGLSKLKVETEGKSVVVSGDVTVEGNYELFGTVDGASLVGQGQISAKATDYQISAIIDATAIDDTKTAINSVDISISSPSIKINYENLVVDAGAIQFINGLLRQ